MQNVSPLVPRLRKTTLSFGAASFHPPLALMPFEKTGGFDSTARETTTPSSTLDILSLYRSAI